ncbi:4a-hydroxytetrahydrobiopterin dehydratase [Rubrobacter taiwanensis]|uniref:Putative pterin-4-alpha-carbinolamine dehydratase n=1 Tax=Rubrobacter taiwanensis TaxID=185139 RepID=A0A4R1BJ76_9ACTN|nr:4a-hydroxytetrahydrobiopterin dehydratase [Rubrobacter taiwanensis]TCJ17373.1 4a-hydroxytetrahydrobiopterin dehydratase [Rubrobacter taiwanensis]
MATIPFDEAQRRVRELPGWEVSQNFITKTYELEDFRAALEFVNRVGELAESANHHPDIDIRYNRVTLTLTTHSEGGLTDRDFELARRIESG